MNIIYLHSHDTGRYVQPYGHAIPTPAYQRLAEEGVLFRQAFCAGPTCSPSRAALLTGQSPHTAGMLGLAHRGFVFEHPERHLANWLKGQGYATAIAGVQHVSNSLEGGDAACGYEIDLRRQQESSIEDRAAGFVKGKTKEPFFLDVGFFDTHREGRGFPSQPAGEARTDARFVDVPAVLPENARTRQDMAEYIDTARSLDAKVGKVLDAVDEAGLRDRTLVILTTDHGIAFPHMKCNLTQHGTGVLLIMRGPGGFDGGKAIDGMVSHIDVFPTICEVLGKARPDWLQGKSMLPLVTGKADEINDEVFSEVTYHAAFEPKRGVRTKLWSYSRQCSDRGRLVLPNCDDGLSKDVMLEAGWAEQAVEGEALYDLTFDPQERCNVAEDGRYAEALSEMRGRLDAWMQRTDDPLLSDEAWRHPEGVKINDVDGLSPTEEPHVVT